MALGGDGPMVVGLMWFMAVLCIAFTVLRTYTRVVIVHSFGMDDIVFILSCGMYIGYVVFLTISATLGFGQNMWEVPEEDIPRAVLFSSIGQTFAIFGMAITKWSLGLFLLRIVSTTAHKVAIWLPLALSFLASLLCAAFFWFGCTPIEAVWNRALPGANCEVLPTVPMYYFYGSSLVFTDIYFAVFPWFIIWDLQMKKREKITILISMSLGVFAAAFGCLRVSQISGLTKPNFLKEAVRIILFSAAEQCVTMICIGIPVCRPLYKRYLERWTSRGSSSNNKPYHSDPAVALRTIGGSGGARSKVTTGNGSRARESYMPRVNEQGSQPSMYPDINRSDEDILADTRRKASDSESETERGQIKVTREIQVTSTNV